MPRITWNESGTRLFEAGVSRGVLYPKGKAGVSWNGLISVTAKVEGGGLSSTYMDGLKIRNKIANQDFAATIKAYTYPIEFDAADGVAHVTSATDPTELKGMMIDNQDREEFGLSYRTEIGNDIVGATAGYKIHLIYNAIATPTTRDYASISGTADLSPLSWDISTRPLQVLGYKPTAHFIIDTTKTDQYLVEALEDILYGKPGKAARMPTPVEIIQLFMGWLTFKVVDNGDGTWTATGPDTVIDMINQTTFEINWYSVTLTGPDSYILSSK